MHAEFYVINQWGNCTVCGGLSGTLSTWTGYYEGVVWPAVADLRVSSFLLMRSVLRHRRLLSPKRVLVVQSLTRCHFFSLLLFVPSFPAAMTRIFTYHRSVCLKVLYEAVAFYAKSIVILFFSVPLPINGLFLVLRIMWCSSFLLLRITSVVYIQRKE